MTTPTKQIHRAPQIRNVLPSGAGTATLLVIVLLVAGCAFDVVQLKQQPAVFTPATDSPSFVLAKQTEVRLGTGFPTLLKAHSTWSQVGAIDQGKVYATKDQVVKVEASNIHEARIVVANQSLVGFYLPVEKTFCPLSKPIPLVIESINQP